MDTRLSRHGFAQGVGHLALQFIARQHVNGRGKSFRGKRMPQDHDLFNHAWLFLFRRFLPHCRGRNA